MMWLLVEDRNDINSKKWTELHLALNGAKSGYGFIMTYIIVTVRVTYAHETNNIKNDINTCVPTKQRNYQSTVK